MCFRIRRNQGTRIAISSYTCRAARKLLWLGNQADHIHPKAVYPQPGKVIQLVNDPANIANLVFPSFFIPSREPSSKPSCTWHNVFPSSFHTPLFYPQSDGQLSFLMKQNTQSNGLKTFPISKPDLMRGQTSHGCPSCSLTVPLPGPLQDRPFRSPGPGTCRRKNKGSTKGVFS